MTETSLFPRMLLRAVNDPGLFPLLQIAQAPWIGNGVQGPVCPACAPAQLHPFDSR